MAGGGLARQRPDFPAKLQALVAPGLLGVSTGVRSRVSTRVRSQVRGNDVYLSLSRAGRFLFHVNGRFFFHVNLVGSLAGSWERSVRSLCRWLACCVPLCEYTCEHVCVSVSVCACEYTCEHAPIGLMCLLN